MACAAAHHPSEQNVGVLDSVLALHVLGGASADSALLLFHREEQRHLTPKNPSMLPGSHCILNGGHAILGHDTNSKTGYRDHSATSFHGHGSNQT